jgi:hypothetical protein
VVERALGAQMQDDPGDEKTEIAEREIAIDHPHGRAQNRRSDEGNAHEVEHLREHAKLFIGALQVEVAPWNLSRNDAVDPDEDRDRNDHQRGPDQHLLTP